jgi:hypothetical protein
MAHAPIPTFEDGLIAADRAPSLVQMALGFIASTAFATLVMVGLAALQP